MNAIGIAVFVILCLMCGIAGYQVGRAREALMRDIFEKEGSA